MNLYKMKMLGSMPGAHYSYSYLVVAKNISEATEKATKEMREVRHLNFVEVDEVELFAEEIII